jgi:toxin ParE1/3/4
MNYVVKILTPASDEAVEAALWYDAQCPGMGAQFLEEVDAAARKLALNPEIHSVRFADVRRAPLRRFKFYGLYYLIREREIRVISVFHGRRHPGWLRARRKHVG